MPRQPLLAAVAIVALSLLPTGAVARPSSGSFPSYVDERGNWAVLSNGSWMLTPTTKAKTVLATSFQVTAPPGESPTPFGKDAVVWAATCARGPQKVALSREVELPGVPAQASFVLRPWSYPDPVIDSVQLLVNGHGVLVVPRAKLARQDSDEYALPASALGRFHLGKNELEVVATKRTLSSRAPACNAGTQSSSVGLLFALQAQSVADLSVSAGKAPVQYFRGGAYQFNGSFVVRNTGPSAALGGFFEFTVGIAPLQGAFNTLTGKVKAAPPFGPCTTSGDLTGPLTVRCPFAVFPAGEAATVSVSTLVKIPADESPAGVFPMRADWDVREDTTKNPYAGTRDPKPDNDRNTELLYLCGPKATDSNCPGAAG